MKRLLSAWPALLLTGMSLLLFAYVGYGEATRVYKDMRLERLNQLGATVQRGLDQFARSGLSLDQLSGFERRAAQLFTVDEGIHVAALVDSRGDLVACASRPGEPIADRACADAAAFAAGRSTSGVIDHHEGDSRPSVVLVDQVVDFISLPVRDKFGVVGHLVMKLHVDLLQKPVIEAFVPVAWGVAGLFLCFTLALAIAAARGGDAVRRAMAPAFIVTLALMIVMLVAVMFDLYRKGVEGQAESLARSLAARLTIATDIGVPLELLTGIDTALADYRRINPNIAVISIVRDGEVLHRAGGEATGLDTVAFTHPVDEDENLTLTTELPFSVVLEALSTGARNFIALFFGCALFSAIMMRAVREAALGGDSGASAPSAGPRDLPSKGAAKGRLALLQPAYFLGILADALVLSILPEMSADRAARDGLSHDLVSLPFSLFFLGLTLALVPASMLTDRINLRSLFVLSVAAVAGGLFLVGGIDSFWALCVGRALGGVGQGMMLVAMQAYAFELVDKENRMSAAAAQVLGYNGGLIVGTGIGGLLAAFNDDHVVVIIAGAVGLAAIGYIRLALPALAKSQVAEQSHILEDLRRLLTFRDFLSVLALVGIPSKFALAGIAMFAMPLLLHQSGFGDDQVGQAMMVFAIVTYLVTSATPRIARAFGSTDRVLLVGMIAVAAGAVLFGMVMAGLEHPGQEGIHADFHPSAVAHNLAAMLTAIGGGVAVGGVIAVSVSLLGLGQGMIAAPIVARIAAGDAAHAVGRDRTMAVYRLLERGGHILGPSICGAVLALVGGSSTGVALLGVAFLGMALLYAVAAPRPAAAS